MTEADIEIILERAKELHRTPLDQSARRCRDCGYMVLRRPGRRKNQAPYSVSILYSRFRLRAGF
jgi:hypothetical protein